MEKLDSIKPKFIPFGAKCPSCSGNNTLDIYWQSNKRIAMCPCGFKEKAEKQVQ